MKKLYTAIAKVTGGRNGRVQSDNGILDLEIRMPKALGGKNDDYTNPEQLFAAGYSACFDSALGLVIQKSGIKAGATTVEAQVSIGSNDAGGFSLAVVMSVNIPKVSLQEAQELVAKAHQVCPYSNATRNNIPVELQVSNDD